RDSDPIGRGWMRGPVLRRRETERPPEARRERSDAAQPDREADLRDRPVGVSQQLRGALEPPGEEILVRRRAERLLEPAAEMRRRDVRRARERRNVERLAETGVDEVFRTQKVARRMNGCHRPEYRDSGASQ